MRRSKGGGPGGQAPSVATIITRECSSSLTAGSSDRIKPFSTIHTTASGRRQRPRCDSTDEKGASADKSRSARGGSAAICSSSAHRAALRLSSAGVSIKFPLSISGDYEYRRVAQVAEHMRNLVVLTIVPPNHPNPPAGRCRSEHLQRAVLAFLKAESPVERRLDFLRREAVGVDLPQVPFYPFELPHARASALVGLQDSSLRRRHQVAVYC
jgi:hypothetical protein